jgi:hypothetical protein
MSERLHFSVAHSQDGLHTATVKAEQVDGEWWVRTTANGVVLAYECLGPVDEVHPPLPRITHERRPRKTP